MASIKSNGTGTALSVIDLATNAPIKIPLKNQEAIMTPILEMKMWISKFMRTGGKGQVVPGGEVNYYAFPKQTGLREIQITYDDTTGRPNNGIYGAWNSTNTYNGIGATMTDKLVKDTVLLSGANFLKHRMLNVDIEADGLGSLVQAKLADYTAENAETNLVAMKQFLIDTVGTLGKWASDAGFVLPTTGTGLRKQSKTYPATAAGGLDAVKDIKTTLAYKSKIGLKDGVEPTYPFARGTNPAKSSVVLLSSTLNDAILTAITDSQNGFLAGIGVNKELGLVTFITYDGKSVPVEVESDIPANGGKAANWIIAEVGKNGAIAMPTNFDSASIVRPDYEGVTLIAKILEGVGLVSGAKALQPELNFGSFEV